MPPTARLLSGPDTAFTTPPATSAPLPATPALLSFRAEAKSRLMAEVSGYAKRPRNWDGEGADAPLIGDVEAAMRFLEGYPERFQLPNALLQASGDVALYWEKGDGYADIEFYMGEVSLYTNRVASMCNEDELIVDLVAEALTHDWIETELGFFKE